MKERDGSTGRHPHHRIRRHRPGSLLRHVAGRYGRRRDSGRALQRRAGDPLDLGKNAIVNRGKRSLALDLKDARAIEAVLRLIDSADALIEGMRPGVMERLDSGRTRALRAIRAWFTAA
jgi:hypothetical protein